MKQFLYILRIFGTPTKSAKIRHWAELQPLATPVVITTSGHHSVVAIVPTMTQTTLSTPQSTPAQAALPKPSFVQALCVTQVPSEPLHVPVIRGETLPIRISNTTYS